MSKLKPCPKCWQPVQGKVTGGIAAFGCGEYGYDVDCKCGISFSTVCCFETPEDAERNGIGQWNTRAERTCRWEAVTNPRGEVTEFMCECGCCMGYIPSFCPSCGARVVES